MSNPYGNPEMAEIGKRSHFGKPGGANPVQLARERNPQSIRIAMRRLMRIEYDIGEPVSFDSIARAFKPPAAPLTVAEIIAIQRCIHAFCDWRAMDTLINMVDGKTGRKRD